MDSNLPLSIRDICMSQKNKNTYRRKIKTQIKRSSFNGSYQLFTKEYIGLEMRPMWIDRLLMNSLKLILHVFTFSE